MLLFFRNDEHVSISSELFFIKKGKNFALLKKGFLVLIKKKIFGWHYKRNRFVFHIFFINF
jgi:hypothetical protein